MRTTLITVGHNRAFCPWKLPDWSKTEPHSSSHSGTTCHKIGKWNTQNQCRPEHSYDGNELALCKTKLIYYSCSELATHIRRVIYICGFHCRRLFWKEFPLQCHSWTDLFVSGHRGMLPERMVRGDRVLVLIWQGWFWLRSDKNYKNSHLQYKFKISHRVKLLPYFVTSYTGTFALPEYVRWCWQPCEEVSLIYPFHTAIEHANYDKADHVMSYTKPRTRKASPTDG